MCAAAASGDTQRDEADEDEADETARAASIADEEERADGEDRRATEPGSPTPNVLTRGAAARNEPSPGTEAFPHSLDSPEGTLMKATTRSQKPKAIASFVRKTLGHHYP